jgi:hypothetical protein
VRANPEKRIRIGLYRCGQCKSQFTVKVGTAFEHARMPLHKMLQAVYLMTSSKKGVSAHQLHRMLEVTYKSPWFLSHRIREAMRSGDLSPLGNGGGIVEVDETFIGRIKGSILAVNSYGLEIALPQVYSNGEVVTVSVQEEGGGFYVHDGSNAAMILESTGVSATTALQNQQRQGVQAYGCMISQFRVYKQCDGPEEIAAAAALVGCASRFVADYAHQAEGRPIFDFRRQLIEALYKTIGSPRVRENDEVVAKTGTRYQVSATILDERGSRPIAYVEAISGHQAVARKFRALYDLQNTPLVADTRRVAIFDDTRPGITSGDIALLREVSEPLSFAKRVRLVSSWGTMQ